jgi:putative DNA primase/helicase
MSKPIVAEDVKPEQVEWLWRGRIPKGMITILAGRPDQGKGLLAARVAADVTQPEPVAPETASGMKVLYSAAEDSMGLMTRPRLEAAGADLSKVYLDRFRLPVDFDMLKFFVEKRGIGLVIMDPFASHLSGGISRHSDNVRVVTDPLAAFIEQTGTSVLIIEHALKRLPAGGHVINAIGGAGSGLSAAARAAYVFGVDPDDDDKRIMAKAKLNIAPEPRALSFNVETEETEVGEIPVLEYDDELQSFNPMKLFEKPKDGKSGRPPDKRADAAEWLTQHLATNGPMKAGVVAEDAKQRGMSQRTLRRAADDMEVVRTPPGGGRNCVWDLSDKLKDRLGIPTTKAVEALPEDATDEVIEQIDQELASTEQVETEVELSLDDELTNLLKGQQPPEGGEAS